MEQLMAHAMASHNQQQHQFHGGQIDMKHFGSPFGHSPHGIGMQQQTLMGNPNMGGMNMNPQQHPSVSLQIPDPHKMVKQEQNYNKMSQQQHMQNSQFPPPDCQYPMMSPAPLAQNLTVNKKEKSPISSGSSFDSERDEPWLNNGNTNPIVSATGNGKSKKGKKGNSAKGNSEFGGKKASKKKKFSAISHPLPPPPPPVIIPEKEKPFECVTCGRRFTQRIGMLQHQRRHTGERPFGCNFCDKRFTQKSGLVQHERLHTNEKPFGCSYCEKAFTQKSGLVQHERTHTGEKPYVCPICAKAFTQLSGLKQHKKVHERSSETSSSK